MVDKTKIMLSQLQTEVALKSELSLAKTEYVNVYKGNISHIKTILENFKENMNKREMFST